jgi:hypothetical protein
MHILLAATSSTAFISSVEQLIVFGIVAAILYWLVKYLLAFFEAPPQGLKIWNAICVVIACFVAINFLLCLTGHGYSAG